MDKHAVKVVKDDETVVHLPRKFSRIAYTTSLVHGGGSIMLLQSKYLVLSVNIQLKATVTYWAVFSSDEIVLMFDLVGEILLCDH